MRAAMSGLVMLGFLAPCLGAAPDVFEEHTYTYTGGPYKQEAFKYRLMKPEKIEAGKKYPLILFLHGAGERGDDNRRQLQYLPQQMAQPAARSTRASSWPRSAAPARSGSTRPGPVRRRRR